MQMAKIQPSNKIIYHFNIDSHVHERAKKLFDFANNYGKIDNKKL
jgi:hypothetical protein